MAQFFDFKEDYYGLTSADAEKRLSTYGPNIYTKNAVKSRHIYTDVIFSPSVIMMLAAGIISFFGIGIAAGIFTVIIDALYCAGEIYFRRSAEKRIAETNETFTIKMRVIRNGKVELIEKEKIVPEDLIIIQDGERVPADAFILESRELTCDESLFTGSPTPAAKYAGGISASEFKPTFVYAETSVLSGMAVCKVSATGVDTKYYQHIGEPPEREPYFTGIEKIIRSIVPTSSVIALVMTMFTLVVGIINKNETIPTAVSALTLGLCFVPTGIGLVLRFYYSRGLSELLKCGAVIRSYNDIEKLNSLSIMCVEKEGAISKDALEVRAIYAQSEELLYDVAALAINRNTIDPSERALLVKASFSSENFSDIYSRFEFIEELPDDGSISGALWNVGGDRLYCIKGAPEQILPMCRMKSERLISAQKKYQSYYEKGWSVIAFACVEAKSEELDKTAGFSYTFVGFAAFSAPLRDSVSTAVKTCQSAGVRVVMLCEDSPDIAAVTAKMIGIRSDKTVTGAQLESGEATDSDIYANISSAQKREIIRRLKADGNVVGMLGTRVADTEPLRTADIGFTIAENCSPSVRESADIVMDNDNFFSIADAIAAARQIHRNIKRGVSLIISGYIGFLTLVIINLFADFRLMLDPPILALFTMLLLPVFALSFSRNKSDMTSKMPSSDFISHRRFNYRYLVMCGITGLFTGIAAAVSYALMYNDTIAGLDQGAARSCGFITLMISICAFAFIRHSDTNPLKEFIKSGKVSVISLCAAIICSVAFVFIPFTGSIFGFLPIDLFAVIISILIGIFPAIIFFFVKYFLKIKE